MPRYTLSNRSDTFTGSPSDDVIHGLGGNDRLNGADGDDTGYGDDGNDFLQGGFGSDLLVGGAGRDTFRWDDFGTGDTFAARADVVADFGRGDRVDLKAVDIHGFDRSGGNSPGDGQFSISDGGHLITWNTHGEFHDVEVHGRGVTFDDIIW